MNLGANPCRPAPPFPGLAARFTLGGRGAAAERAALRFTRRPDRGNHDNVQAGRHHSRASVCLRASGRGSTWWISRR